jgi:hypothetical protein
VRVSPPVSSRFTDGRSLPLPGAVALALQALLQKYPSYAPPPAPAPVHVLFNQAEGSTRPRAKAGGVLACDEAM